MHAHRYARSEADMNQGILLLQTKILLSYQNTDLPSVQYQL